MFEKNHHFTTKWCSRTWSWSGMCFPKLSSILNNHLGNVPVTNVGQEISLLTDKITNVKIKLEFLPTDHLLCARHSCVLWKFSLILSLMQVSPILQMINLIRIEQSLVQNHILYLVWNVDTIRPHLSQSSTCILCQYPKLSFCICVLKFEILVRFWFFYFCDQCHCLIYC